MPRLRSMLLCPAILLLAGPGVNASTLFVADITTSQETTPVLLTTVAGAPRATPFGTATFELNDAMTALTFTATIFNIDVTGSQTPDTNDDLRSAHIHASATSVPGVSAGVVWGFFGTPFNETSPNDATVTPFAAAVGGTFTGKWDAPEGNSTTLTAQLGNLLAGRAYINFHTAQNPGGEIRGQIVPASEPIPEPSTFLMLGAGIGLLAAARWRKRSE